MAFADGSLRLSVGLHDLARAAYSEGSLERDVVPCYALNSLVGNDGLAILQSRCHVDRFPLDRHLCNYQYCVNRASDGVLVRWRPSRYP